MTHVEAFDVAVVGGGCAGVAAALSAARVGARTLLVEETPWLGGNAANAHVHTICGLYHAGREGEPEPAHAGFPRRFAEGLRRAGGAGAPEWAGRVAVLPTAPAVLAAHAASLCAAQPRLTTWTDCPLVGIDLALGRASASALALAREGVRTQVRAAVVVDTSGDGEAAARGGAACDLADPEALQAPSYVFRMGGVDTGALAGMGSLRLSHAVAGAVRDGSLPPDCGSIVVRPGRDGDDVYVTLNVPKLPGRSYDPLDTAYRSDLEAAAREAAGRVAEFLCARRPPFSRARVADWPRRIGIRETRRVRGLVEVSETDVLEGRRRSDEVALSTWPIELWRDHRRAHFQHPKDACGIPLGALVSASHPRLGMAGRCLSASHEALGSLRVIGTALATGEAAGIAAALAADAGAALAEVEPAAVRERIQESDPTESTT